MTTKYEILPHLYPLAFAGGRFQTSMLLTTHDSSQCLKKSTSGYLGCELYQC